MRFNVFRAQMALRPNLGFRHKSPNLALDRKQDEYL